MITMEHVCKTYRIAKRNAGAKEAWKALFRREYEEIRALDDVSFTIRDGEMVGYIGPNGAGKSSTIKILSGILTPDGGTVLVDGRVPYRDRLKHVREIGVVFGQRSQLWWDVPVIDSFELLRDIYSIPNSQYRQNLEELTQRLHLEELLRTPARQLSLGQRMRCEIAASLLHGPRILFLDEPTIGLDAVSKLAVREFILEQNREHGTTVILTTHDMQDIEALTSRILLIGKGRILLDGTLEDIRKRTAHKNGFGSNAGDAAEKSGGESGSNAEKSGGESGSNAKKPGGELGDAAEESGGESGSNAKKPGNKSGGAAGESGTAAVGIDETVAELYRSFDL